MEIPGHCLDERFKVRLLQIIRLQLLERGLSNTGYDDDVLELMKDILQEANKRVLIRERRDGDPEFASPSGHWLAFFSAFTRNIAREHARRQKNAKKAIGTRLLPPIARDTADDGSALGAVVEDIADRAAVPTPKKLIMEEMCGIALEEVGCMRCRDAFKKVVELICVEKLERQEAIEIVAQTDTNPMSRASYWRLFRELDERIVRRYAMRSLKKKGALK